MKREPEGMEIFVCWTCKEFGHFSSRCRERVIKSTKCSLSDEDEEFKESMEIFLNECNDKDNELELVKKEEVVEEIALVTIVESVNVRVDEKFRIQERVVDYNSDDDVVTKPRNVELFLETNIDF